MSRWQLRIYVRLIILKSTGYSLKYILKSFLNFGCCIFLTLTNKAANRTIYRFCQNRRIFNLDPLYLQKSARVFCVITFEWSFFSLPQKFCVRKNWCDFFFSQFELEKNAVFVVDWAEMGLLGSAKTAFSTLVGNDKSICDSLRKVLKTILTNIERISDRQEERAANLKVLKSRIWWKPWKRFNT